MTRRTGGGHPPFRVGRAPGSLDRVKRSTRRRAARTIAAAVLVALATGGCTTGLRDDDAGRSDTAPPGGGAVALDASGNPVPIVPNPNPGATQFGADGRTPAPAGCSPGPGKRVEKLPDVVIPPIRQPATSVPDQVVGGERIAGFTIPAVEQPALAVDTGCIVRYDAPAGCLGAVEISEFTIPGQQIPGYTLPGYAVGGRQVPERSVAGDQRPAVTVPGQRVEQVCQREPGGSSRVVASVFRKSLFRPSGNRPSLFRNSASRASSYLGDDQRVESVQVPALQVDGVQVHSVQVDSARIDGYVLDRAGGTEVLAGEGRTAYSTQADVLFDFGRAELKPAAIPTLRRIAADLLARVPDASVQVDGHTDDVGDDAANVDLSTRRAEAVEAWLSAEGGVAASRIRTRGYGESAPVAPNATPTGADDPQGRAQNRRVVISATGR